MKVMKLPVSLNGGDRGPSNHQSAIGCDVAESIASDGRATRNNSINVVSSLKLVQKRPHTSRWVYFLAAVLNTGHTLSVDLFRHLHCVKVYAYKVLTSRAMINISKTLLHLSTCQQKIGLLFK